MRGLTSVQGNDDKLYYCVLLSIANIFFVQKSKKSERWRLFQVNTTKETYSGVAREATKYNLTLQNCSIFIVRFDQNLFCPFRVNIIQIKRNCALKIFTLWFLPFLKTEKSLLPAVRMTGYTVVILSVIGYILPIIWILLYATWTYSE